MPNPRKRRPNVKTECTIPPAVPETALSGLVFRRDPDAERQIREYVEWQSQRDGDKVTHAEQVRTEYVLGRKLDAWDVRTTQGRWWVITSPTNLYSQELFPSLDYTISFHVGVTARMMAREQSTPRVEAMEQALMPAAWRKWQQAAEALDEAEEPEDFQAVGMRCREALMAMVKAIAGPEMVVAGAEPPKRGDVRGWAALIADHVAHGDSAEYVRGYLKAISKTGWDLAGWLTHAQGATNADAAITLEAVHHVLGTFGAAVFRYVKGIPDRCPACGSYQSGLRRQQGDADAEPAPGCQRCGWIGAPGRP